MIVAARLSVAIFKIISHTCIYTAQALWFGAQGRTDKIGGLVIPWVLSNAVLRMRSLTFSGREQVRSPTPVVTI